MINALPMELSDACGDDPGFICEWIWDNTENEKLSEIISWIIERPLKVVVILFVAMIVNRLLRRAIDRMVERIVSAREQEQEAAKIESEKTLSTVGERARRKLQRISEHGERSRQRALTLGAVLRGTSTAIVYLMGLMIALGEIGLDLGPLLAGAGIVGLAIGFGAQSLVSDFIAGVFVIIEDQYGVGDWVDVGSASGTVEKIKHGDIHAETEVVIKSGSINVIVTKKRKPYHKKADFTDLGLNPNESNIVIVKIGYLVPELYQMRGDWIMALTPGGVDQDIERLDYKRIKRPMFPFDYEMEKPNLNVRLIKSSENF